MKILISIKYNTNLTNVIIFMAGVTNSTFGTSRVEESSIAMAKSIIVNTVSEHIRSSFIIFKGFQGTFLSLLFRIYENSNGDNIHRNAHGAQTNTVFSKHGVKYGSSVSHVRLVFCNEKKKKFSQNHR